MPSCSVEVSKEIVSRSRLWWTVAVNISKSADPHNCLALLRLAKKTANIRFLILNSIALVSWSEVLELSDTLAQDILSQLSLEELLKAMESWNQNNPNDYERYQSQLLQHIRPQLPESVVSRRRIHSVCSISLFLIVRLLLAKHVESQPKSSSVGRIHKHKFHCNRRREIGLQEWDVYRRLFNTNQQMENHENST